MVKQKLKYTLTEANDVIAKLSHHLDEDAKLDYRKIAHIGNTAMWKYCKGNCPSLVAANHLAAYIEEYCKNHNLAAV